MPGFDGTGPRGRGMMTGGGRGYCAVNLRGLGMGGGRGFFRRGRGAGLTKDDGLVVLKEQADYLKGELDAIETRIKDLETKQGG